MPSLPMHQAAERLAKEVENATPPVLCEIYAEVFPGRAAPVELSAAELAHRVRCELLAEELVDLWNVVFPADWNVWYDEEGDRIRYNEEVAGYAEKD